jgi:hypothetical protein
MTASPNLLALLDAVRVLSPSRKSAIHGETHWRRVATTGLELAAEAGADPLLVFLFAIFHDSMCLNDESDPEHGMRGGALARSLNRQLLHLAPEQLELLNTACAEHTEGGTSEDPTIGVCWDADRLDLWRVGQKIDAHAMSTAAARTVPVQERARALLDATPEWPAVFGRLSEAEAAAAKPPPGPIERREYDPATLMRLHRPVLRHPNKQLIYVIACPDGTAGGHVSYTRWAEMPLPKTLDPSRAAEMLLVRDGFFDYERISSPQFAVEWHLNFADPNLFYAYGSALFAQDELQVAEHPVLAALREALVAEGRSTTTIENGRPTPVLVMGAERRVRIDTGTGAERVGPSWLYGMAFANAAEAVVREATRPIDPPTTSNVIAICAPFGGIGRYRREQISLAMATAYSGFRAAVLESRRVAGSDTRTIVHSGFWGCGAFGGVRVLMTIIQLLAAEAAGLDKLVLHIGDPAGRASVDEATAILRDGLGGAGPVETGELLDRVESLGFEWGHSDGN